MWIPRLLKADAPSREDRRAEDLLASVPYAPASTCLSPAELMRFAKAYPTIRIPNGRMLFREGTWGCSMYLLVEGHAEVSSGGRLVDALLPGAIVGEMSLVIPGPRPFTVSARSHCGFAEITEREFYTIIRRTPEFAGFVMRALARQGDARNRRPPQGAGMCPASQPAKPSASSGLEKR